MAAHRFPIGKSWQSPDVVFDPSVLAVMKKVQVEAHPDYAKLLAGNASSRPTRIEIRARGQSFVGERRWAKGTPSPDPTTFMTNQELEHKFAVNAEGVISPRNTELAVEMISNLESVKDVGELMQVLRP